jgi:hypothetical protein
VPPEGAQVIGQRRFPHRRPRHLRNVNTGAFELYNIANNQITGAALLGQVGLDWLGGYSLAVHPAGSTASRGDSTQADQLAQAMAGFVGGSS